MQRTPIAQTRRDAWVEVNLGNIEHNVKTLKTRLSSGTKLLAVVKADGYGHGSTMITPTLAASGVDMLGVASVDEGIELRNAGIVLPILVLGATPEWAVTSAVQNDLQLSIFTHEHIKSCIYAYNRLNKKPDIHIKVDTGMHRIGVAYNDAPAFIKQVENINQLSLKGVFSHLACAENRQVTSEQVEKWENLLKQLDNRDKYDLHLVNTAGMLQYTNLHQNMARVGIGIYGLVPDLKQAMSLRGRISHIQELPANSGISYDYSFITEKASKIATIPVGYADGVARNLSNRIYGLINGRKARQVGNITMDQMMFDVTDMENIGVGDIITLLGEDNGEFIPVSEWARKLNTINYEIVCRLRVRLPRVYTRSM